MFASQPDTDRRGAPWSAVALLAAVVGGLVGAGVDRLLFAAPTHVAAAQDQGPAQDTLEHELKALSAAIVELQKSVDRLATPAAPADTAAPTPAALAAMPDVQATLADLVAAVADATQRLSAATTAPLIIPPADAEIAHRLGALPLNSETLDAQHLFWPAQAVLDAYGRPSKVYVNDRGEQWVYDLASPHEIGFTFHDGHVIEVWTL